MKQMMTLLALTCLFFISCDKSEKTEYNMLKDREWSTNYLFCFDEATEEYSLKLKSNETVWGNFVHFSQNGTFESYIQAECGNGCFKTVNGRYRQVSEKEISVSVNSVSYSGWCTPSPYDSTWIEVRNGNPIYFTISKIDNGNMVLSKK